MLTLRRVSTSPGKYRPKQPCQNLTAVGVEQDYPLEGTETTYLLEISVGTPQRNFLVILDTGSCEFWLTDEDCKGRSCRNKKRYSVEKSRTGKGPLGSFKVSYIDSALSGHLYQDHIKFGPLLAENLHFGGAVEMAGSSLNGMTFDGVLGLCPSSRQNDQDSFVENLHQSHLIEERVFSLWFGPDMDDDGKLTLGRIATEYADSDIVWMRTRRRNKWATSLRSFRFDDTELVEQRAAFILDSGSTMMIVPERAAQFIHSRLRAWPNRLERMHEVSCEIVHKLEPILIKLPGLEVYLEPEQYILVRPTGCFSAFEGRSLEKGGVGLWVMGCPFLRSYFTAYDLGEQRFGIALPRYAKRKPQKCLVQ